MQQPRCTRRSELLLPRFINGPTINYYRTMKEKPLILPGGAEMIRASAGCPACRAISTAINPKHYTSHPSGIECIQVTEHMNFCRGNAIKYLWRCGEKGDAIEDLEKAKWYIEREIERLRKQP